MPRFEIELDDKGDFVGTLPPEVAEAHKRIGIMAHGTGFQSGQAKAAEDAKQAIADAIKAERTKLEAQMPLEREKWQAVEDENKTLKSQYTDSMRESSKTLQKREEAHAEEITRRVEALNKRNGKIQALVNANLRALAAQLGARDESLGELEVILQHRIGYDDDMDPYVKAEDGTPAKTNTGNAISMEAFVKTYLDNHPHHRKPTTGRGGDARGGASLRSTVGQPATLDAAKAQFAETRSPEAINAIFEAGRSKRA